MVENCIETAGISRMAFYVNKNVIIQRPDPAIENEVSLISYSGGSVTVDPGDRPKWKREIDTGKNYVQTYIDSFSFQLNGLKSRDILDFLRKQRKGFITEIITTGNESYIFPSPVFVSDIYSKENNSRDWTIELSYRVPTLLDKLTKNNTLLMTANYILVGGNEIMSSGTNEATIWQN